MQFSKETYAMGDWITRMANRYDGDEFSDWLNEDEAAQEADGG